MSKQELIEKLKTTAATGRPDELVSMAETAKAPDDPRKGLVARRFAETPDDARHRARRVWREFDGWVSSVDPLRAALEVHVSHLLVTDASFDAGNIEEVIPKERAHLKEVAAMLEERDKTASPIAGAWSEIMAASPDAPVEAKRSAVLSETFGPKR